jgi:hypothetical protein
MKLFHVSLLTFTAVLISGCKPNPYPKHPNYAIEKPKVRYTPKKKNLERMVKQLQGSPYVWAEEGPDKFDCSGFTYYLYGSMGIDIPRVAREQAKVGKRISPKELQYGDLIFFATDKRHPRKITHVGMYLGDGWFTHASTVKEEVIYSNLFTSPYYKKRLRVCRRYLPEEKIELSQETTPWRKKSAPKTTTVRHKTKEERGKAIVINVPMKQLEQQHAEGNYYVQIGSFIGRPNASLLYKITRMGLRHKIISFPRNGQTINKLLVGPYPNRTDTEQVLQKIRKHIQQDAFIAEIR